LQKIKEENGRKKIKNEKLKEKYLKRE